MTALLISGVAIAFIALLTCWIPNGRGFRVDLDEGFVCPPNWFCWGEIRPWSRNAPIRKYAQIRLPSFSYHIEGWTNVPCWHQLMVLWAEGRRPFICWVPQ